jgi:hypothetical protein
VIRQSGEAVAEHGRPFGRDQTVYDQWHDVPVLAKKPCALRSGAPFKQLSLPPALERLRGRLKGSDDGDRQMVKILMVDGLDAVEAAAASSCETREWSRGPDRDQTRNTEPAVIRPGEEIEARAVAARCVCWTACRMRRWREATCKFRGVRNRGTRRWLDLRQGAPQGVRWIGFGSGGRDRSL